MCWICDHPEAGLDGYLDKLREGIARSGLVIQHIEGDNLHPPWAYTAGLSALLLPELVVTGMDALPAAGLLNKTAAARLAAAGAHFHMTGRCVRVIAVTRPWTHLKIAAALYGKQIQALQLVHADSKGRWPWNTGYHGEAGAQPVLGMPGE